MAPPRVFISYAWESDDYRLWVERLATRLRENGIDARLDTWHLQEGSIPDFMNREVRKADRVLVLCSPAYRTKVHLTEDGERVTGSGWEAGLLSSQLFANLGGSRNKGVPILAMGTWTEAAPDFLLGEIYVDLSQPDQFEDQYTQLLRRLTDQTSEAPPLGPLPTDLQPQAVEPLRGGGGEATPEAATGDVRLDFTVYAGGTGETANTTVTLRVDDGGTVSAEVPLDLVQGAESQTGREVRAIEEGRCTSDDIQSLGSDLWIKLLKGPLMNAVESARKDCRERDDAVLQLRLGLPEAFEGLPWEALYDFEEAALATSPATALVRTLHNAEPQPKLRDGDEEAPLRMLVVIPALVAKAVSTEWEKIQQSVRAAGGRVQLELLDGPVTIDRFTSTLRKGWDILHFLGDGEVDEMGRMKLRFDPDEEGEEGEVAQWLPAPMFAQQFLRSAVQLVVLNCRHGDSGSGSGSSATGGQPGKTSLALGGLGSYLLKARVPAVVVMRYRIEDRVVADFSRAFYHELLSGPRAGRVDLAVQEGRSTLLRNHADGRSARSYITPALYLAPGCEQLFHLQAQQFRTGVVLADQPVDPRIPEKLLYAFETGRCLPILGPGILGAAALREAGQVLGPRSLAAKLGADSHFPDHERLTAIMDSSGEWLTSVILERICQHFECEALGERFELQEAVSQFYRNCEPSPEIMEMGAWKVAGMVYAHIDGVLERALYQLRGRNLRVVQAENLESTTTPAPDDVVLLNLRGTYTNPASLTLTELDQDRVLDRVQEIASFVEDLMNARPGCSLLFLGVSPRDPLVRALSRRLLRTEVARNRGTAYFINQAIHKVETAYWRFERLEWVELDVETVIRGLTMVAARAAAKEG